MKQWNLKYQSMIISNKKIIFLLIEKGFPTIHIYSKFT